MNNFDKIFAEAVNILLEKKKKDGKKDGAPDQQQPSVVEMISWKPGKGNWGQIVKGLKEDAEVGYEAAVARSSAVAGKSKSLMARLQVSEPSTSSVPVEATAEILVQALKSPIMAQVFELPTTTKTAISIPIKLSTEDEDIRSGEGISARNATAFIHLTLLGAYNAGMLKINKPVRIEHVSKNDTSITIIAG